MSTLDEELQRYQILSEQYYGKNKMTLKMEEEFKGLKKLLSTHTELTVAGNKEIRQYADNLENHIKELFNFKNVRVDITNIGEINAYTYSKTVSDIIKKPLYNKEENKKYGGIQYTDDANRSCVITMSIEMIKHKDFTPGMLTCVLLHEIGHNFYIENSISFIVARSAAIMTLSMLPAKAVTMTNIGRNFNIKFNKFFDKSALGPYIKIINNATMQIKGVQNSFVALSFITGAFNIGFNLLFKLIGLILELPFLPFSLATKSNVYNDELFADNFATSYGYGPERIQISKVSDSSFSTSILNKATKLSVIKMLVGALTDIPTMFDRVNILSDRASNATRALDQVKYLRANLKSIENAEQRESLKRDLEASEKALESYKNHLTMTRFIRKGLNKKIIDKGGDLSYKMRKRRYDSNGNWKNLI